MIVELIEVGVALLAGLMMTRLFKLLHLNFPDVTAFLVAGLAIGPYALGFLSNKLGLSGLGFTTMEEVDALSIISNVALGFIAFAIGNEFRLSQLKETGKQATIIGIVQAVIASLLVDAALIGMHFILGDDVLSLPAAITLGAIASATAPAATLMVVRQYKAKGKVTDLLLPIVALDDAVGLVVFAISFGIARSLRSGNIDLISIIVEPIIEIVASLLLGSLMGFILTQLEKLFYSNGNRLALAIGFVFLTIGLASLDFQVGPVNIHFSSLLVCMMLGTMFCNLCERSPDIMGRCDKWTVPLNCLFFVLSGAELELSVFKSIAVIGIGLVYIIARSAGKYLGARVSAQATGCNHTVQKYLGITLLPQAGVALGMAIMAREAAEFTSQDVSIIVNIVLFSVLVYELVGPQMTKMALTAAGEIEPQDAKTKSHDRFASKPPVNEAKDK